MMMGRKKGNIFYNIFTKLKQSKSNKNLVLNRDAQMTKRLASVIGLKNFITQNVHYLSLNFAKASAAGKLNNLLSFDLQFHTKVLI